MEEIDRVFEVTFARWRRKLGDSNLESAWRRASNSFSSLILFPTAAIVLPLALFGMAMMHRGYSPAVKRTIQMVGVLVWFLVSFLFDRRFRLGGAHDARVLRNEAKLCSVVQFSEVFDGCADGSG